MIILFCFGLICYEIRFQKKIIKNKRSQQKNQNKISKTKQTYKKTEANVPIKNIKYLLIGPPFYSNRSIPFNSNTKNPKIEVSRSQQLSLMLKDIFFLI